MLITVCMSAMAIAAVSSPDQPKALVAVEQARHRLKTGYVEWSRDVRPRPGRSSRLVRELFFTSRFAGDAYTVLRRGDRDGVLYRDEHGKPVSGYTVLGRPEHCLFDRGEVWKVIDGSIQAECYRDVRPPLCGWDIRALGLSAAVPFDGMDVDAALWRFGSKKAKPATYESRMIDGLHEVRAKVGRHIYTWRVDPVRGWNPVRVWSTNKSDPSRKLREVRVTLKSYDGTWFPEAVALYVDGRDKADTIFHVLSASFNRPEHPRRLTPKDIGVEPGMSVAVRWPSGDARADPAKDLSMAWDGKQIVEFHELNARFRAGTFRPSAGFRRRRQALLKEDVARRSDNLRRIYGTGEPPVLLPDQWEQWLDGMVLALGCTEVQRTSARAILKEVHRRAEGRPHLHAELLRELKRRFYGLLTPDQRGKLKELEQIEAAKLRRSKTQRRPDRKVTTRRSR